MVGLDKIQVILVKLPNYYRNSPYRRMFFCSFAIEF